MNDYRVLMRGEAPVHPLRTVFLPPHGKPRSPNYPQLAHDKHRPPDYVLGGWSARKDPWWWFTTRNLRPRSGYQNPIQVAWVGLGRGGSDPELRFRVWDAQTEAFYGCDNDLRRIPEGDPLLSTPTSTRLFGSRGVYPAHVGDFPVLLDFCDRLLLQFYPLNT